MNFNNRRAALSLAGITAGFAFFAGAALAAAEGYNVIEDPVNGALDGGNGFDSADCETVAP